MSKFIKFNKNQIKKNSSTCEVAEYLFNQPNLGIAKAKINGWYPTEQAKKVVNNACDVIYFVLDGTGTLHTKNGDFKLSKNDAVFLPRAQWYWVAGKNLDVLVVSAPEWTVEQYREI